ncbi:MAG: hypothetical protein ACR2KJ_00550 [Jatrophihabitans sp.]
MESNRGSRHDTYVGQAIWLVRPGRADLIDLIADEYERHCPSTDPPPDPKGGRDTETEFMIRYAG